MPHELPRKDNKLKNIVIVVIILALVGGIAMYFFTKNNSGNPNTDSQNTGKTQVSGTPQVSVSPETTLATAAPTLITDKSLSFFIDKNHNQVQDSGESVCTACKSKTVLVGIQDGGFGPIKNATTTTVDNSGKINTAKYVDQNTVWGSIEDKSLLVLPTTFALGDGAGDIMVPVWDGAVSVSALNANVTSALDEDGTVVYEFTKLIPSMKALADKGSDIWVKFTPNSANDAKYFLASGKISATSDGYSLKVNWDNAGDALNVLKIDNIKFVVY